MTAARAGTGAAPPGRAIGPVRLGLLLGYVAGTSGLGLAGAPIVSRQVAGDLAISTAQTAWVLALFSLGIAVMTPVWGRLADLHGGRRVVASASACALLGTGIVLLAPSLPVLLVGRFLQGGASSGLSIVAFALPAHRLDGAARAHALGIMTALAALTLGSGPLFGAAAEAVAGWRAALALSVIMLLAAPALARLAAPPLAGAEARLDLPGAGLVLAVGTGCSVLLQARTTHLSPPLVAAVASLTVGAAALLTRHVRRTPYGFLPLTVVRNPAFVALSLGAAALMAGFLAMGFLAPLLLTDGVDRPELEVGLILLPAALAAAVTAAAVGRLRARMSAERILAALGLAACGGMLVAGVGHALAPCVVVGAAAATSGFAGAQVALLDRLADLVPEGDRGIAIGVFNLIFVTGGAIGAALAGALVDATSLGTAVVGCAAVTALAIPAARVAAAGAVR